MKKWILWLLLLCLLLAGCGAKSSDTPIVDPLLTETIDYEELFPEDSMEGIPEEELHEETLVLQQEALLEITAGISDKVYSAHTAAEGFAALSDCEKIVFAVDCFDMEVQNGGLCQFLVNSGDVAAPYLSEALEAVGAQNHQMLFSDFLTTYEINVNDLSSFKISSIYDYQKQYERYPFYEFDDAYVGLEPLSDYLWTYVEANVEQLR